MSGQAVLIEMNQALDDIGSLQPNWDSYGAPRITEVAIKATKSLLSALVQGQAKATDEALRPYSLIPLASGGVQLTWRSAHIAELEVEVGPDGRLGYLLVPPEGLLKAVEQDDVSPQTVIALVDQIAGSAMPQHAAD
jgi:hypothetical protein